MEMGYSGLLQTHSRWVSAVTPWRCAAGSWGDKLFCSLGLGDFCCPAVLSALSIWLRGDSSPLASELKKLSASLPQMQLVHTSHGRKGEHVNSIMVAVSLQAAVHHRGSGIWHYELCRNVPNTGEIQHSSRGTSRDLVPSQWHNHQSCMQIRYTKQWSPALL